MSIQASITTLKTLQVLDGRIGKIQAELSVERVGIDEKSERHLGLVAHAAKIESIMAAMEGTKAELNSELRQHMQLVDKSREKMTRCRNEREANAVQRELEEIRRLTRDRELEIQKLTGLIEDARADLTKVEEERTTVASQIDETEGEATAKVRELQENLLDQQEKRRQAMATLPSTMIRKYEAVQKVRGTGAAGIIGGSCTACHIHVSPMLWQEIQRLQELHQCPNCHRILYKEEAPSEVPDSEGEEEKAAEAAASEG